MLGRDRGWLLLAGSKVTMTSIVHMTWEMLAIMLAYQWTNLWRIRGPAEVGKES